MGETVSRNIIHWKWNQKWRHFKFAEHSCEFHKKDFFYPHFIGDLYWGSPTQMKKPSEKLVNLPMDTSLVSAGVGIWPDLFPSKSHAIHTGCKSLVIISIVTEAKCWFVHNYRMRPKYFSCVYFGNKSHPQKYGTGL